MQAFYDAFFPRAEEAIAYCDKFPLDELPDDVLNLLHLLYSMIMVSFPVEAGASRTSPTPAPPPRPHRGADAVSHRGRRASAIVLRRRSRWVDVDAGRRCGRRRSSWSRAIASSR